MSRLALLVSESGAVDETLEPTLQRHGYARVIHSTTMAHALATVEQQPVDLLVAPIEIVDEGQLAVLDRLNRREKHVSIIATGETTDPALMLRAMRAGIQEFLFRPIVAAELQASLERLARRTTSTVTNGQVYAVFGSKGGVGTSTAAVNLAHALSLVHTDARVAVADAFAKYASIDLLATCRSDGTADRDARADRASRESRSGDHR